MPFPHMLCQDDPPSLMSAPWSWRCSCLHLHLMPADLIGADRYAAFDPDLQVVWFLTEHACKLMLRDQQCQIRSLCTSRMRKMRRQPRWHCGTNQSHTTHHKAMHAVTARRNTRIMLASSRLVYGSFCLSLMLNNFFVDLITCCLCSIVSARTMLCEVVQVRLCCRKAWPCAGLQAVPQTVIKHRLMHPRTGSGS